MVNTKKLKGKLREKGMTQSDLAKALKLSSCSVNRKINGKCGMTLDEAEKTAEILGIGDEAFRDYFFVYKVAICNV